MAEIDFGEVVDSIVESVREEMGGKAREMVSEWLPVIQDMGAERISDVISHIMNSDEESAIESSINPLALLKSANEDVESAISDRETASRFVSSVSSAVRSIGGAALKAALVALI